ncbi:MAG: phage portal protein [Oenococcus sp.]|uniref:phage portal protein n=1 Tax=Oenococcus sp. TaxID=1979414 RepID=UPI0039E89415
MGIAIDESLLENVDDPSYDVLNYAITKHANAIKRLDMLSDYYKGKQAIMEHKMANNTHSSNAKVMVNHAKYIVDMNVGFTVGNPIGYTAAKDKNIDDIVDLFNRDDIKTHDTELEKDLSTYGIADELYYLKPVSNSSDGEHTELRIASISPKNVIMVTDDTVEHNPIFAIYEQRKRNLQGQDAGYLMTVYTRNNIIEYRTQFGTQLDPTSATKAVKPHYFGDVPVTEFKNNQECQGDFEQVISQIDAYNTLQSDRITDKQDFIDALLVVYGFTLEGDIKDGMINGAPGKGEDGASVEWLTKQLDETQAETLALSIENDIHKTSYVPNMNDKNFMGNISGEAMKYKLFGLLNLLSVKTSYMAEGLRRRLRLVQAIMKKQGFADDATGCKIIFTPNIPVNLADTINNIKNADGIIPRKITYGWLPDVDSPEDVEEQMNQQNADNIKANQAALTGDTGANIDQPPFSTDPNNQKGQPNDSNSRQADQNQQNQN